MSFICPACSTKRLSIALSLELPPDSRSDEITLQIVECAQCGFAGVAVYEESRRGALDSESVDHYGFRVSASDLRTLKKTMKRCSQPRNSRCVCRAHRTLGRTDAAGRWNGLRDIDREAAFALRL